jgi:hypothetical protein
MTDRHRKRRTSSRGPYPLSLAYIDCFVAKRARGTYVQGTRAHDGSIRVLRVGRSDKDLNARLKQYLRDPAFKRRTHFYFELASSERRVFDSECFLFHFYMPSLNAIHPASPRGARYSCRVRVGRHA